MSWRRDHVSISVSWLGQDGVRGRGGSRRVSNRPVRNLCQCVTWPLRCSADGVGCQTVIGQWAILDHLARMNSGRDDAAVQA